MRKYSLQWVMVWIGLMLMCSAAEALIMVGKGEPVTDQNWPAGSLDVANLKTRIGWWEGPPFGGGQWNFQYRGDTKAFQEALDLFAKIKAPKLRLVVHEGPQQGMFLETGKDAKADTRVDWTFVVWNPNNWNRLYNNPQSVFWAQDPTGGYHNEVDPPRMDVYVTSDGKGVNWKEVKVPEGLTVEDQRATAAGYPAEAGSVVRGDVYDMVTSKPIAGAKIVLSANGGKGEASGVADASGHVEIKNVQPGNYQVVARADGYVGRILGYASVGKNALLKYETRLLPPVKVSGKIVDDAGKPLAGINIHATSVIGLDGKGYLLAGGGEKTSDQQGQFAFDALPTGHLQIFAFDKAHHQVDPLKLYSAPDGDVVIKMEMTGTIKGKVIDAKGAAATGISISVYPEGGNKVGTWGGSMNVGADGKFEFDTVPPGTYYVSADPGKAIAGNDPDAKKVIVKAGETAEVEVMKK